MKRIAIHFQSNLVITNIQRDLGFAVVGIYGHDSVAVLRVKAETDYGVFERLVTSDLKDDR